jgi:hypothetical protein
MRTLIVCTLLLLGACAKKSEEQNISAQSVPTRPVTCVFLTTLASHAFRAWPAESADQYHCVLPEAPKMDCYYFEGENASEIQCYGKTQTLPTGCAYAFTGSRDFFSAATSLFSVRTFTSGANATSDAYNCSSFYGYNCAFYEHTPNGSEPQKLQDLQCTL